MKSCLLNRRPLSFAFLGLLFLNIARAQNTQEIIVETKSNRHPEVTFTYYRPHRGSLPLSQVLLLIPGYNGSGSEMFTTAWKAFAEESGLILLAPTFMASTEELEHRQGYYYPDQWSGEATENALAQLGKREGIPTDKVLIFGFSAGAHFAHRFALWNPHRVKAFVAYSAAWWDKPTKELARVPALIMCGEADFRYDATRQFMAQAQNLNLPWVWRSYRGTGHEMIPAVQRMAQIFIKHYALVYPDAPLYGDVQTYRYVTSDKMESIPAQERIRLPSKAVAEQWTLEN